MTNELNQTLRGPAFEPVEPEPEPTFEPEPGPPVFAPPSRSSGGSARTRLLVNGVLAVAFVILVGGVAFAVGRATGPSAAAAVAGNGGALLDDVVRPGNGNGPFAGAPGDDDGEGRLGPGAGSVSIEGTVTTVAGDSMTIELADGRTVEVAIDENTGYHRQAGASASDVTSGTTVSVAVDGFRPGSGAGTTATDVTIVP
jgi:hypothetical protein